MIQFSFYIINAGFLITYDLFQNLDLTQHKLIYEGTLTHKKQPQEQLHGLLFETMVVLLHKKVKTIKQNPRQTNPFKILNEKNCVFF